MTTKRVEVLDVRVWQEGALCGGTQEVCIDWASRHNSGTLSLSRCGSAGEVEWHVFGGGGNLPQGVTVRSIMREFGVFVCNVDRMQCRSLKRRGVLTFD